MENWQKGDVFAQMHFFTLPSEVDSATYTFNVGLYRLDTMERLPPVGSGANDHLILGPIGGLDDGR